MNNIWETVFSNQSWGRYPPISLIQCIARSIGAVPVADRFEKKVLELGAGPGANLWYLAREGFEVHAVEGSPTAVNIAMQRLIDEGLESRIGEIRVGDFCEQSFPEAFFDAVIDVESLYCNSFEDSKQVIGNALSWLKPGGVLYSQTFAEGSWGFEVEEVGYHAVDQGVGPLQDKGYARYATYEDVNELYSIPGSRIRSIERLERHLVSSGDMAIKEWVIEVIKE